MSYRSELIHASLQASANAARIDQAVNHLLDELHLLDGYPTTTTGAANQGPRGQRCITVHLEDADGEPLLDANGKPVTEQVPVTTVEDVALKRQAITDQLADLHAQARGVLTMHNQLAATITQALRTRVTVTDVKPCDATGREGYMIPRDSGGWSDLACTNIPARGTLCIPCYHRERRWRTAHGLPTREEAAA